MIFSLLVPELEESDHIALVERGPLGQAAADALDVGDQRAATNELIRVPLRGEEHPRAAP